MMHVKNDVQLVRAGLLDAPIDAGEKRGLDGVGGVGQRVGRPFDGQADGLKARCLDDGEVFGLERDAPFPFLRRFERVAQIDAAAKPLVGGGDVFSALRVGRQGGAQDQLGRQEVVSHER
jgi:hypothetical protein